MPLVSVACQTHAVMVDLRHDIEGQFLEWGQHGKKHGNGVGCRRDGLQWQVYVAAYSTQLKRSVK
jgi:hypothetical protein